MEQDEIVRSGDPSPASQAQYHDSWLKTSQCLLLAMEGLAQAKQAMESGTASTFAITKISNVEDTIRAILK